MIKKTSETRALAGNITSAYNDSQTSAYSTEYINDINTYSTSETFTGKYWVDGKKIYRKVITGTLPSLQPSSGGTADGNIPHGISNLDTVVNIYGELVYSNTPYKFPVLSSNGKITAIRTVNSTNIVIRAADSWQSGPPVTFVVEYTKTTD